MDFGAADKCAGYVLVGGRSSRMGRDKAFLPFRGGVLAGAVARAVAEAAGSAVLVGNPAIGIGYPAIPDLYPGEGPLGGILTALRHTSADWNAIVACDLPDLGAALLRELLREARRRDAGVLMAAGRSGQAEPLCAVYHRRVLAALEEAFGRGIRKITEAARNEMQVAAVECELHNVNTPEDWAGYAGK